MVNVNKLFPRLSIRVKLAIAFALVALGPLAVVSFMGARETVRQIESNARNALAYDLEMAETQTARELQAAEQHVDLVTKIVQGPLLKERFATGPRAARNGVGHHLAAADRAVALPGEGRRCVRDSTGSWCAPRATPVARSPPRAASTTRGARAS